MYFFFFFQAEDGIRDGHVTGVQTCALPISTTAPRRRHRVDSLILFEAVSLPQRDVTNLRRHTMHTTISKQTKAELLAALRVRYHRASQGRQNQDRKSVV